jgi:hypothetical protein
MSKAGEKRLGAMMYESDSKAAAAEAIRQLLEQTEKLAAEAGLTEVAFLIGVAQTSLTQEGLKEPAYGSTHGTSTQIM